MCGASNIAVIRSKRPFLARLVRPSCYCLSWALNAQNRPSTPGKGHAPFLARPACMLPCPPGVFSGPFPGLPATFVPSDVLQAVRARRRPSRAFWCRLRATCPAAVPVPVPVPVPGGWDRIRPPAGKCTYNSGHSNYPPLHPPNKKGLTITKNNVNIKAAKSMGG